MIKIDHLESDTRHVKASTRITPTKATHKHEYFLPITWNRVRLKDVVSKEKYKFTGIPTCVDCGHENRRARRGAVEIEFSVQEFNDKFRKRPRTNS